MLNELQFENYLKTAFGEYIEEQINILPADEELSVEYPVLQEHIEIALKHKKTKKISPFTYLKRVAVIFLVVSVILFCALMFDDNVRAMFTKTIEKWYNGFYEIVFEEQLTPTSFNSENNDDIVWEYIPQGFKLVEKREGNDFREYIYTNSSNKRIVIIYYNDHTNMSIDNEKAEYEFVSKNGINYWINYYDKSEYGTAIINKKNSLLRITACIPKEDLVKIIENLN